MTVINAAHNKNTVALVGDLQLSGPGRKSFNGDKLYVDTFPGTISGITGQTFFIDEAIGSVELPKEYTPKDVSEQIHYALRDLKKQKINRTLDSAFGLSIEDLVRGHKKEDKVDEHLIKNLQQALTDEKGQFKDYLTNEVVTVGFNGRAPEIYVATPLVHDKIALNFMSVGSGADLSSQSLSEFYETINDPNSLSTTKMVESLVRAKIKSEKNRGVGGTSDIAYIKRGSEPVIISENQSVLFEEIIKCKDNNLVGQRVANQGLNAIINGGTFEEIEPIIFGENLKSRNAEFFLRGYNF